MSLSEDYADIFNVKRKKGESEKAFKLRLIAALQEQGKIDETEEVYFNKKSTLREWLMKR